MRPRPRILLFDLDGTLVLTGGAGKRSLRRAFDEVCGASWGLDQLDFGGMTDQLIVRETLLAMQLTANDGLQDRLFECYLVALHEEVADAADYRIMPGVESLLPRLADETQVVLGLGTGNIERGARIKLERGDLNRFFEFGGFGCDHIDRAELLRAGARRGAVRLGKNVEECRVIVIGDTPRDIRAAAAIGAECIAVATGGFTVDELQGDGVSAFPDLTAPEAWRALT